MPTFVTSETQKSERVKLSVDSRLSHAFKSNKNYQRQTQSKQLTTDNQ